MSTRTFLAALVACVSVASLAQVPPTSSAPSRTPVVFLNHFFVVLDAKSYAAMQDDPYMRTAFAPFEKRTTVRNDSTYTGAYWYGRHTYFEVFEPESQGPQGASGIAFSVDGEGESKPVAASWNKSLGGVQEGSVTRKTETAEPVWFQMTAGKAADEKTPPKIRLWLMEYDKDFLRRWYPELTSSRDKTRGPVLDRYVAKIGRSAMRDTAVFGDVSELLVALDDGDRVLLVNHLVPVGWVQSTVESALVLRGPEGVAIRVIPVEGARRGIVEAVFRVQGAPKPHRARLGNVSLTVTSTRARLRFVP